jgi:hypothetical protein
MSEYSPLMWMVWLNSKLLVGEKVDKQADIMNQQQELINLIARALARMVSEQKKLEGLSLVKMKDVQDFLRNYDAFEEVLRKPKKDEITKEEQRNDEKADGQ